MSFGQFFTNTGPLKYSVKYFSCSFAKSSPYSGLNSHSLSAFFKISIASLWSILTNFELTNLCSLSINPFSIKLLQNSISSGHFSKTLETTNFKQSSSMSINCSKSQNAISGSIIQNSLACVFVFEFSLLNVGPNV